MYLLKSNSTASCLTIVLASFLVVSLGLAHDAFADKVVGTISLGHYVAGAVAVNPQTNMVYVTNPNNSTVSVINGSSDLVVGQIPVRPYPSNIAVNPFTDKIYVTHPNDGNVTVIDGSNNSVKTISVPGSPSCIAVNPNINMIYVMQNPYHSVTVIDGSTNRIVHTVVPFSSVYSVWNTCLDVNPTTDNYYVTYATNPDTHIDSYIAVIGGSYNNVFTSIPIGMSDLPGYFAIDKNSNMVYALGPAYYDNLYIINGTTNGYTNNIVLQQDSGGIDVNPYTHVIYVANHDNNTLYMINGTTKSITGKIPVGTAPASVSVDPLRDKIYVTNQGDNTISIVQGSSAPPQLTSSQLRVNARDSFDNTRAGLQAELFFQNGTRAATASAPFNFVLSNGQSYTVHVENNATYIFDHWADTGSTSATRTISVSSDSAITAVYRTMPSQPTGLAASSTSSSQVSLGWSVPASNGGAPITNYDIYRSTASGSETLLAQAGNVTSYADNTVAGGQIYYYYVSAVNSVGSSASSNEASVAVSLPQAPHSVTQISAGLVASDSLDNQTKTQQQLQSSQQYWKFGGDAPSKSAPYSLSEDMQGLHIGVKAASSGTWSGYYAKTPNTAATLFHGIISIPLQTLPTYNTFYQNGLYVDTPSQTNYLSCGSDTSIFGTSWTVNSITGNSSTSTPYSVLWTDYNTNHSIRDCTIITNGLNYLKVYLDGKVVYQSSNLNLQMTQPFNAYLRTETSYAGQLLNGTYSNFYATSGENVTVSTKISGASTAAIVNSMGSILASAPVIGGSAVMPIGRYDMPLYANVILYDSKGMQITSTSSPGNIYGGDAFSSNSSGTGTTPQAKHATIEYSSNTSFTGTVNSTTTVIIDPGVTVTSGGITNYGNITNRGTLDIYNTPAYFNNYGVFEDYGSMVLGFTEIYTNGTFNNHSTIYLPSDQDGEYVTNGKNGIFNNFAGATIGIPGRIGYEKGFANSGTVNNNGTFSDQDIITNSGVFNNNGTVSVGGIQPVYPNPTVTNSGKFYNMLHGTISNSGYFDNACQATYVNQGTLSGNLIIDQCRQAPQNLKATPANSYVILSWAALKSNSTYPVTSYEIYRGDYQGSDAFIAKTGNVTSFNDTTVANGNTYFYKISAANSTAESPLSSEASATPYAPMNLVAKAGNSQVSLSWSAAGGGSTINNYNIYRGTASGGESSTPIASTGGSTLTYSDAAVTNGQTYYYIVKAVNQMNAILPSNEASATPTAPVITPPPPTQATIAVNSVDLCANPLTGLWTIARYANGTTATQGYTPASFQLPTGTKYVVHVGNYGSEVFSHWSNGNTTSYYTINLTQNATLTAYYSTGSTCTSPTASPPGAPTGLAATAASSSQVNLSWTAPSSNGGSAITGYNIYRGTASGSETRLASVSASSTSYADAAVTSGQRYFYEVTAVNAAGESARSTEASATPPPSNPPPNTPPSAPTNLAATGGNTYATLSWTAPSSNGGSAVTGYNIYRGTAAGAEVKVASASSASYNDTGLTNGQKYFYEVTAVNAIGESAKSAEASATPTAPVTTATSIVLNNVQSNSGTTSPSNQITISSFNAGSSTNQLLVVGISANNQNAASVTFNGTPLTKAISSFTNNDAEFWYLKNPSGTGNVVATFVGATQAVVGAYSLANVDPTTPIATTATNHNTASSSPSIQITTKYANDLVLDLPSIYGGQKLGLPTCTQEWNTNIPSAITGASSSTIVSSPGAVTCGWTASPSGDLWDDVAIEIK